MLQRRTPLLLLLGALCAAPALAASPPCTPCAGIRVDDPSTVLEALSAPPTLEGDARLYVAWDTALDGAADASVAAAVREAGATPWQVLRLRTPTPIAEHAERLDAELREIARLASSRVDRAHFQLDWQPESGDPTAVDRAFLIKRAAVAVTGADPQARVILGPLAADAEALAALYAEDIAAYVDGIAFAEGPPERLAAAVDRLAELDPGKAAVLDALPWPAAATSTLAGAADAAERGFAVALFGWDGGDAGDLAPLKLLAREFQGDMSLDPHSRPTGAARAWSFVRGEDLSLRVIAEPPADAAQVFLTFDDPQLRSPALYDPADGTDSPVFGQRRTQSGLLVPVDGPGPALLLRLERMTAAELEGIEEQVEVADERQLPVEEILRRLQAFEDDQARRVDHYQATNTMHLRFQLGSGLETVEASFEGDFFFRRGEGFDWVWETLYFNGVKWRGKTLPEIPLIQPEKAAALPLEIHLSKEYSYRLRGAERVNGRDCWAIEFRPLEVVPGEALYQGTVWVDRQLYSRVRTRALQVGLEGEVLSNEETYDFSPVDARGRPVPWSREAYVLPTRMVGAQLLSVLNTSTQVERELVLTDIRINGEDFDQAHADAKASDLTMVRDTDDGLRYLVKDEAGERVVKEGFDVNRLFLAVGTFFDDSTDFPLPLAGINYLSLDFRGSGNQLNFFFAGPLLIANIADPDFLGSRWDAGASAFGFLLPTGDELYRDGREVPTEEVESSTARFALFLGRPIGNYAKIDFTYALRFDKYQRADDTAEAFVLPQDTLTHSLSTQLTYTRGGYRLNLEGGVFQRDDWQDWGLPGNPDFDEEHEDYVRWQASLAKTWWLPNFLKLGVELEHLDGEDLDRFSKWDFGTFGDASVAGYPSGLVRAESSDGIHLGFGFDLGSVFRVELEGDAVWVDDEATGLEGELLAGIGLEGTTMGPWRTIVNFELGQAVAGPGDGFAGRIVFLKLLR